MFAIYILLFSRYRVVATQVSKNINPTSIFLLLFYESKPENKGKNNCQCESSTVSTPCNSGLNSSVPIDLFCVICHEIILLPFMIVFPMKYRTSLLGIWSPLLHSYGYYTILLPPCQPFFVKKALTSCHFLYFCCKMFFDG